MRLWSSTFSKLIFSKNYLRKTFSVSNRLDIYQSIELVTSGFQSNAYSNVLHVPGFKK